MKNQSNMQNEIQKEIDIIGRRMLNQKARRVNDKSTNKLMAVSILLFVFIVLACWFGGQDLIYNDQHLVYVLIRLVLR